MVTAFRYHHYEWFCSQIDQTELTVVEGWLCNSLNKRVSVKIGKNAICFVKNTQNQEKHVPFCLQCAFFCFL